MNTGDPDTFVYLLVDNGLLNEVSASYTETDSNSRPTWLSPIYPERALAVSPLLIDLEAAYEGGDLDQIMHYLNALQPALHVSIIETDLNLEHLAQHLRRFIFILDPAGKQFTFRYADCNVLTLLPSVLTPEQWASMHRVIKCWDIHLRTGKIARLESSESTENLQTPLSLDYNQLVVFEESSEPDHYLAKVKIMRNDNALPGNSVEQHCWARAARQAWLSRGNSNSLILLFLTEAALMTQGKILHSKDLGNVLAIHEAAPFRKQLLDLIDETSKF
jgi:hypothetical protein